MISSTRMRGSSEAKGSWKIIWMASAVSLAATRPSRHTGLPSKARLPSVGGRMPATMRPKVDLPQPDSPTRPTTSPAPTVRRSEEHTSELQSLMRISYAVFCLKKKKTKQRKPIDYKDHYETI